MPRAGCVIPPRCAHMPGSSGDVVSVGLLTRVEIWAQGTLRVRSVPEGEIAEFMADLGLY